MRGAGAERACGRDLGRAERTAAWAGSREGELRQLGRKGDRQSVGKPQIKP